jgi:hypothetical protein
MTKLQILQRISEEDIIKKYFPDFDPASTKNYRSPFADKDENPSLSFYQEEGKWKFKSHNTGHGGDVFQFVADLLKLDCKANFSSLLEAIAKDFGLNGFHAMASKTIKISFEKEYTKPFTDYFQQYGIEHGVLKKFDVRQIRYHEFYNKDKKVCKFDYQRQNKVAVGYLVKGFLKVYFPAIADIQEKAFGYKDQTSDHIFGLDQLTECESLFIAAGEKDCLALNAQGFTAISFQSENHTPTHEQIEIIQKTAKAKFYFVVYDNDEAGIKAANKLITATDWRRVQLPPGIKDAADFFLQKEKERFIELLDFTQHSETKEKEKDEAEAFTLFHACENYLTRHYDLRFNTVSLELEVSRKGQNQYELLNENDLFIELNKHRITIGMDKLIAILKSSFVKKYNPLKSYFENLPVWDSKEDPIAALASYLKSDNSAELTLAFKKWLVRAVKCVMLEGYYNKQAFILVHSEQNSGKTTFCRFLCPPTLKDYIAENISDDKDSKIAIAKNFLINLDELSSLAKHEINSLKALFSKDVINERLPYDRKNSIIHRTASFIGSTNMAEFLTDETGSVRWLCFEIKSIDWKYKQAIDIDKVWSQAYGLFKSGFDAELTPEEIQRNEKRNSKYQQLSTEAELIPNFLKPTDHRDQAGTFMSATDVILYLNQHTTLKLNKVMIGRAMPMCGFRRVKDSYSDRWGYWCIKLR